MSTNISNEEIASEEQADQFIIVSVEKSNAPQGSKGENWYRYVVERGNSQIVGNMCGDLQQVEKHVNEFVENLNDRISSPKGRSLWSPTRTQQKQPPVKTDAPFKAETP